MNTGPGSADRTAPAQAAVSVYLVLVWWSCGVVLEKKEAFWGRGRAGRRLKAKEAEEKAHYLFLFGVFVLGTRYQPGRPKDTGDYQSSFFAGKTKRKA